MPQNVRRCKQRQSILLLLFNSTAVSSSDNNSILSQVFSTMRSDEVSLIARNDWLIKEVGLFLVEKYAEKQQHLISQKMRELARLLTELCAADFSPNAQLSDFIKPEKFDVVVSAVKNLSKFQFQEGVQRVATPSMSLKVGHSLKKMGFYSSGPGLPQKGQRPARGC